MYAAIIGALTALAGGTAKAVKAKKAGDAADSAANQATANANVQKTAGVAPAGNFGAQSPVAPPGANTDPMLQPPNMQTQRKPMY